MREPTACTGMHTDAEAWVDPRDELTALIHDLSDHARQALLDYLKELLRTSTTTLYSLFCLGLCLPALTHSCGLVRGFGCAPASWPAD